MTFEFDTKNIIIELNTLRRRVDRLDDVVEGRDGKGGLEDTVKGIALPFEEYKNFLSSPSSK